MSLRTEIQGIASRSMKAVLDQTIGVTVTFTNPGEGAVSISANRSGPSSQYMEQIGLDIEEIDRVYTIPKQTSFPPSSGIQRDATITDGSDVYEVVNWNAGSLEASYRLFCKRITAVSMGV